MSFFDYVVTTVMIGVLFIMMKNLVAKSEIKKIESEEVLFSNHDKRTWVKVLRIICGVIALVVVGLTLYIWKVKGLSAFLNACVSMVTTIIALLFFAVAPYDSYEWVINEKGVFIYNIGQMIPWGQIITTGIQQNKKNPQKNKVVLQIKKVQGELFKAQYQILGVDDPEKAEEVAALVREFIHALDRKKMFKREQEEKKVDIRKRRWGER